MNGAAQEKIILFMTVAVEGNALSDVCGLNLQCRCRTVKQTVQSSFCWLAEKIMAQKESTRETVLQVNSFIRGYHEYQEIWTPEIRDEIELRREPLLS